MSTQSRLYNAEVKIRSLEVQKDSHERSIKFLGEDIRTLRSQITDIVFAIGLQPVATKLNKKEETK